MKKQEWADHYGFCKEDMDSIELALSISDGKIVSIIDEPLKYQDIKIKFA